MTRRGRGPSRPGGVPIEEAPWWALAIFAALLWLLTFPALVGLLAGLGMWRGEHLGVGVAALALAAAIVAGAALQKPWRRATGPTLDDPRPLFIRFSTWLLGALLIPNVLFGVLVLTRPEPGLGYREAAAVGLLISIVHGVWALLARWRRRSADPARARRGRASGL